MSFRQLEQVESDEAFRRTFDDPDYELLLLETGFRRPLSTLGMGDKDLVERTVKNHLLSRVKGEMDQFLEGLAICGVGEMYGNPFVTKIRKRKIGTSKFQYQVQNFSIEFKFLLQVQNISTLSSKL